MLAISRSMVMNWGRRLTIRETSREVRGNRSLKVHLGQVVRIWDSRVQT